MLLYGVKQGTLIGRNNGFIRKISNYFIKSRHKDIILLRGKICVEIFDPCQTSIYFNVMEYQTYVFWTKKCLDRSFSSHTLKCGVKKLWFSFLSIIWCNIKNIKNMSSVVFICLLLNNFKGQISCAYDI